MTTVLVLVVAGWSAPVRACTQAEAADALGAYVVAAGFDLGGQTEAQFVASLTGMPDMIPMLGGVYIFTRTTNVTPDEPRIDMFMVREDDCAATGSRTAR